MPGPGVSVLTTGHGVRLLTPGEAAELVRVGVPTIANWRRRGILKPAGADDRGFPVYTVRAVRDAEAEVRRLGMERTGVDPRRMRKPKPRAKVVA